MQNEEYGMKNAECKILTIAPPGLGEIVEPMSWFDTPGPFELEIGCGKGRFLLHRARSRPDVRMLGIEWAAKFYRYAADRMTRWGVSNVRVMRTDASEFVTHHLPAGCLTALHIYHPDPWPKKRHHKRRLIQPAFVESAIRATVPNGRWLIQTDYASYYEVIRQLLDGQDALEEVPFVDTAFGPGAAWQGTNYEVKYAAQKRTIYRVAYCCKGVSPQNGLQSDES